MLNLRSQLGAPPTRACSRFEIVILSSFDFEPALCHSTSLLLSSLISVSKPASGEPHSSKLVKCIKKRLPTYWGRCSVNSMFFAALLRLGPHQEWYKKHSEKTRFLQNNLTKNTERPQDGPKWCQDRSKMPRYGPMMAPGWPLNLAQNVHKMAPGAVLGLSWGCPGAFPGVPGDTQMFPPLDMQWVLCDSTKLDIEIISK